MDLCAELPPQYLFNTLKHHSGFVREFIQKGKDFNEEEICQEMRIIGRSMIDMYCGELDPIQITGEIGDLLLAKKCFDQKAYTAFINKKAKNYSTVLLSDSSEWILLVGRETGPYIHIHPARGSKHTIRIKAIALKTAILIHIFYLNSDQDMVTLANKVRQEILRESPIKNQSDVKGLERIMQLLL